MLRVHNLQVDVPAADHDAAVAYWAAALGGHDGGTGDATFTHLHRVRSPLPVHLQRGAGAESGRYHLDLVADDVDSEVERLLDLGAVEAGTGPCRVLEDPAGLAFCVCANVDADQDLRTEVGDDARLHLVVLDVPSDAVEAVVRFWSEALGLGVHPVGGDFAAYTFLGERAAPPLDGWGLLVQDVGETPARMHVDLHVPTPADRDREVARLRALGAAQVGGHDRWVVLEAPGGHLHCIVPDRPS